MPKQGNSIYIVDDDGSVLRALSRLVRTEGYEPVAIQDGFELVRLPDIDPKATVICDLRMPGITGVELFRMLRCRGTCNPFIFVSALDDDFMVNEAKLLGHAFFSKPVDAQELLQALSDIHIFNT